jgi:hypothetical protein
VKKEERWHDMGIIHHWAPRVIVKERPGRVSLLGLFFLKRYQHAKLLLWRPIVAWVMAGYGFVSGVVLFKEEILKAS